MWNLAIPSPFHMESRWNGDPKMSGISAKTYSIWSGGFHMNSIWNKAYSRWISCGIRGESKDLLLSTRCGDWQSVATSSMNRPLMRGILWNMFHHCQLLQYTWLNLRMTFTCFYLVHMSLWYFTIYFPLLSLWTCSIWNTHLVYTIPFQSIQ